MSHVNASHPDVLMPPPNAGEGWGGASSQTQVASVPPAQRFTVAAATLAGFGGYDRSKGGGPLT